MFYPAAFLLEPVRCQQVFRVIIAYLLQRAVLPILGLAALCDRISDLNVGIIQIPIPENEVAFQFADPADADLVSAAFRVEMHNVFEYGTVVHAVIRIIAEIEAQVGNIVFLFALDRPLGLHIEPFAGIEDLRADQHVDIIRHGRAGDVHPVLCQRFMQAVNAHGRAEIVDYEVAYGLERLSVVDLDAPADILLE